MQPARQSDTSLDIQTLLQELGDVHSTDELKRHPRYVTNQKLIEKVTSTPEYFVPKTKPTPSSKSFVRICAWNIERGISFEGILHTLKTHPLLSTADVLLLSEVDCGMARTKNRHVARELGEALQLYALFGPAYINLDKGNGAERSAEGENTSAIQGHAILSRYPMEDLELIPLPTTEDHMAGKERQIGAERAVVASVATHLGPIHAVASHLSLRSSRKQRVEQILPILTALKRRQGPVIIGGDWNTTTYNSNGAWPSIIGFWVRVAMGIPRVVIQHYPYPNRFFEKKLFDTLKAHGFETEDCNFPGGCTVHYDVNDPGTFQNLGDWIPDWCFKFIRWALRNTGGVCSFKLDWFAARNLKASNASVVYNLPRKPRISDHDPIVVDVQPS